MLLVSGAGDALTRDDNGEITRDALTRDDNYNFDDQDGDTILELNGNDTTLRKAPVTVEQHRFRSVKA